MSIETIIALLAALGVGGLLGNILTRHYESQKQTNEHDIKIFNQSNEILTEQKLSNINIQLIERHSIVHEDFLHLRKWCEFIEQNGNKYIHGCINKESQKLLDDLKRLVKFITENFEIWKNPEKFLYLKPELDPDKVEPQNSEEAEYRTQALKYEEYTRQLQKLIKDTQKHYATYRLVTKRKLKI